MRTRSTHRGILVAIEGIDGAGKTTQVRLLERGLVAAGIEYIATKEPTQGPWGQKIRASAVHGRLPAEEELDAFVNDRREHVDSLIEPSLQAGKVVVVDRYYFSTVAYQGARGLDPAYLLQRNAFAPSPQVLIILDIEPAIGLQRIQQRGDRADLFEREEELAKVRQIFRAMTVPNLHILDGSSPPEELAETIGRLVAEAWQTREPNQSGASADDETLRNARTPERPDANLPAMLPLACSES